MRWRERFRQRPPQFHQVRACAVDEKNRSAGAFLAQVDARSIDIDEASGWRVRGVNALGVGARVECKRDA
jgi:hypothetical protein